MVYHGVMLVSVVGHCSIVSLALLSSVDFGTTVPPLTEFIKNLLGKYTEGQILKVSEEQYNLHTMIYTNGYSTYQHHTIHCYSANLSFKYCAPPSVSLFCVL